MPTPDAKFGRLVHLTNHSEYIRKRPGPGFIGVYEGKFIEQYDGRFAGFNDIPQSKRYGSKTMAQPLTDEYKKGPSNCPEERFYIEGAFWKQITRNYPLEYSLFWRSLTSPTNRRTCIATIHLPTAQSLQFLQLPSNVGLAHLLALFNSLVFDYLVRAKISGIDLTQAVIRQTPVPPLGAYHALVEHQGQKKPMSDHIAQRVSGLLGNDLRLRKFAGSISERLPESIRGTLQRRQAQLDIDLLIARAYALDRSTFLAIVNHFKGSLTDEEREWLHHESDSLWG